MQRALFLCLVVLKLACQTQRSAKKPAKESPAEGDKIVEFRATPCALKRAGRPAVDGSMLRYAMASENQQPDFDPLDEEAATDEHGRGFVTDFVRRMAAASLGAVVMSEEGIRKVASQLKLPKEVLGLVLTQAEKTKEDIGRVVVEEVRKFLQSDRMRDEFLKVIAGMTIEVRAEVKLVPDRVKGEAASLLPKVTVSDLKTKYEQPPKKKKKRDEGDESE